jgi:hypothetical protein
MYARISEQQHPIIYIKSNFAYQRLIYRLIAPHHENSYDLNTKNQTTTTGFYFQNLAPAYLRLCSCS